MAFTPLNPNWRDIPKPVMPKDVDRPGHHEEWDKYWAEWHEYNKLVGGEYIETGTDDD